MAANTNNKNLLAVVGMVVGLLILGYATFRSCAPEDSGQPDNSTSQSGQDIATKGPDGSYTRPPVKIPIETNYSPPPTPSTAGVPPAVLALAKAYVTAKENQDSFYQTDLRSWTREVDGITGPLVHEQWEKINPTGNPGYAWTWAHQEKVKTQIDGFSCRDNPEVPSPNPAKLLSIRCGWIAVPVYANGDRVPPNKIDFVWEYNGPRGPAVLSVVNDGGWKITMDATGIAQ